MRKIPLILLIAALSGCLGNSNPSPGPENDLTVMAEGLEIPWAMDFLPDGDIVLTERPGRIRLMDGGRLLPEPAAVIEVATTGESGLLGIAVDPEFSSNSYIYVYYTYFKPGSDRTVLLNRVSRMTLSDGKAGGETVLIDGIPGGMGDQGFHNGGRLKFGPDGKLYATTGDGGATSNSRNARSLGGKILRINKDGSIPADNPIPGSPVYSMGHRNPQGLAWHSTGKLFATEHGPVGNDELNLIIPGKDYLWPDYQCTDPADPAVSCFRDTLAPSGAAFHGDKLYIAGLRGTQILEIGFSGDAETILSEQVFLIGYGRIRDVVVEGDTMYVLTSNRDGRSVWSGNLPSGDDDRLISIDLGG